MLTNHTNYSFIDETQADMGPSIRIDRTGLIHSIQMIGALTLNTPSGSPDIAASVMISWNQPLGAKTKNEFPFSISSNSLKRKGKAKSFSRHRRWRIFPSRLCTRSQIFTSSPVFAFHCNTNRTTAEMQRKYSP